ncbi:hypothetical protein NFI96_005630 [Prochilodus magdalenae]|nr:hypothetical protein NFI96_005630 [Prochilodus magdalenae]
MVDAMGAARASQRVLVICPGHPEPVPCVGVPSSPPAPGGQPLGPTLGLYKSSSLESLQTAMEEANKSEAPFHRPAVQMVRGRGVNMSFRQAIDKSYDGPSEPDDDYSDDSSGRDTPASSSSRQELDDGAKEKKKKTKKKKEKKTKAKKKEEVVEDPEKKTKKKGFGLLRSRLSVWSRASMFANPTRQTSRYGAVEVPNGAL